MNRLIKLFYFSLCFAMLQVNVQAMQPQVIQVTFSDAIERTVPCTVYNSFITIKDMLEDLEGQDYGAIPVPNVDSETYDFIVDHMQSMLSEYPKANSTQENDKKHRIAGYKALKNALYSYLCDKSNEGPQVESDALGQMVKNICAANYLDCQLMLDATIAGLAQWLSQPHIIKQLITDEAYFYGVFGILFEGEAHLDTPELYQLLFKAMLQHSGALQWLFPPTCSCTLPASSPSLSVAWSPDGTQIASGSDDKSIKIWNASTGTLEHTLNGHNDWVSCVAWSPAGTQIASGSGDNSIKIWNAHTGTLEHTLNGHMQAVCFVTWSPDGTQIASGSGDSSIKIWNAHTGTLEHTLTGHMQVVFSVAWSPDGTQIASGSYDGTIKIWHAHTSTLKHTLNSHNHAVYSVAWNPGGTQIASGSNDNSIKIWNAHRGTLEHTLNGHIQAVRSVAWSPDGTQIVSGSADSIIKIWNTHTGTLDHTLNAHNDWVYSVAWSSDGTHIASCSYDNSIKIWNINLFGREFLGTLTFQQICLVTGAYQAQLQHLPICVSNNTYAAVEALDNELQARITPYIQSHQDSHLVNATLRSLAEVNEALKGSNRPLQCCIQ